MHARGAAVVDHACSTPCLIFFYIVPLKVNSQSALHLRGYTVKKINKVER